MSTGDDERSDLRIGKVSAISWVTPEYSRIMHKSGRIQVMKQGEVECPYCECPIPLEGDEREGGEVFCSYCSAPLRLAKKGGKLEAMDEEEYEEEFG
jgi:uncharacterized Zn-finger protein